MESIKLLSKNPLERLYGKFRGESILELFEQEHAEELIHDLRSEHHLSSTKQTKERRLHL
jgi:hypothetical protein